MNKTDFKKAIYSRLESTQDDIVLEIVYDILENGRPIQEHILKSESLKQAIDRVLDDINNGRLVTNHEANKEIDEWLNK